MSDADSSAITGFTGVYNADGGLAGEVRYVVGHLLGTAECALCDITHSPVRRKPEWDRMVARFAVPVEVKHRNEIDERVRAGIRGAELPVVVAHRTDGGVTVALTAAELAELDSSVEGLERALESMIERESDTRR